MILGKPAGYSTVTVFLILSNISAKINKTEYEKKLNFTLNLFRVTQIPSISSCIVECKI